MLYIRHVTAITAVFLFYACSATSSPTVSVSENIILPKPSRLGINIGKTTYYGDHEMMAAPFAHGDFRRGRQAATIQVGASSPNSVTMARYDPAKPSTHFAQSFAGGRYFVATGPRAGEQGGITSHDPGGAVFGLSESGPLFEPGDVLWLAGPPERFAAPIRKEGDPRIGIGDFRARTRGAVRLEFTDGPGGEDDQALEARFNPSETGAGGVAHYVTLVPGARYTLHVRARADGPHVRMRAVVKHPALNETDELSSRELVLPAEWKSYAFPFQAPADMRLAQKPSSIEVWMESAAAPGPRAGFLDYVTIESHDIASPTGFSQRVVNELKSARCGVLRFSGIAFPAGHVDSITARSAPESGWTYVSRPNGADFHFTHGVVDNWMALAREVGADPWLHVGAANTPDDWYALISYLAAPADFDAYAQRRASHGYAEPWLAPFDRIYLEIGNEWWNSIFDPFYIESPEKYGELCRTIIQRIRRHPYFDSGRFRIICGGWAANGRDWNRRVDAASDGHDLISIAPYLLHRLDDATSHEAAYGALFADVDAYASRNGRAVLDGLAAAGKGTGLCVYELNTHITGGAAPASAASEICPSVGAGIAVLDQALSVMSHLRANPINYFQYFQRSTGSGENTRLGLWGALIRTAGGEHQARPLWLGLKLANQYVIDGDMLEVTVLDSPTWRQSANGSLKPGGEFPYLHAYAFRSGRGVNVLLINRRRTDPVATNLRLPFEPRGEIPRHTLTSDIITANNENAPEVRIVSDTLGDFVNGGLITLPPFSATALQFAE